MRRVQDEVSPPQFFAQLSADWAEAMDFPVCLHSLDSELDLSALSISASSAQEFEISYDSWRIVLDLQSSRVRMFEEGGSSISQSYIRERLAFPLYYLLNGGAQGLHASAVSFAGRGLAFWGEGGAGKSTFAVKTMALSEKVKWICDDFLCLSAGAMMLPLSRHVYLREAQVFSFARSDSRVGQKYGFEISEDRLENDPVELRDLILIEGADDLSLQLVDRGEVLDRVIAQFFDLSPGSAQWRRHRFGQLFKILRSVPRFWKLSYRQSDALESHAQAAWVLDTILGISDDR